MPRYNVYLMIDWAEWVNIEANTPEEALEKCILPFPLPVEHHMELVAVEVGEDEKRRRHLRKILG